MAESSVTLDNPKTEAVPKTEFGQNLVNLANHLEEIAGADTGLRHRDAWLAGALLMLGLSTLSTDSVATDIFNHPTGVIDRYSVDPDVKALGGSGSSARLDLFEGYSDQILQIQREAGWEAVGDANIHMDGAQYHIPSFAEVFATHAEGSPLDDSQRAAILDGLLTYKGLKLGQEAMRIASMLTGAGFATMCFLRLKASEPLKLSTSLLPRISKGLATLGEKF